jgi:hypothetical protein
VNISRCDSCGTEHPTHLPKPYGWRMTVNRDGSWTHTCAQCMGSAAAAPPKGRVRRKRAVEPATKGLFE